MPMRYLATLLLLVLACSLAGTINAGVNYEEAPINYSASREETAITRLQARLDSGDAKLSFEEPHGYLKSLLQELDISVASQVLAFSKTSAQADKISPATPRAIYFNEEVHIGYVQHGMIEIAAADPNLGMVFYTLEQTSTDRPNIERQNNRCLTCHASTRTKGLPGLFVRSVFTDGNGQPVVAAGSHVSTHASPLEQRWGGWYVTGTHGNQKHLGNFRLAEARKPKSIDNVAGPNLANLSDRFDTSAYLTPHSDLVALMVLEHQTDGYNKLTQANFEIRHALHLREQAGIPDSQAYREADADLRKRVDAMADRLAKFMLFADEAVLTAAIAGTSSFSQEISGRGQHGGRDASLRELDLQTRLFKYSCSYLIDAPSFLGLPLELRRATCQRILAAVTPDSSLASIRRLTTAERDLLHMILAKHFADHLQDTPN